VNRVDVEALMHEALAEAEAAGEAGEYPIGAVVAIEGAVISRGRSRRRELRSQLAHAELGALQRGGELLWERHDDAVLITTVEPCPLCLGAAVADVPHIVFAHPDPAVQSAESRALFERFEPQMLDWLDDRVVRHRQQPS